jgi:hypothetical protein
MAYAAVRCYPVELTGRWRGTVFGEGDAETHTDYEHRAAADGGTWRILSPLYRLPDGREVTSRELPAGAVYLDADGRPGFDGLSVVAVCPDGTHWRIDSRCSNCGRPEDDVHRCWIRDGDPRTGRLTVSKGSDESRTCKAGGGSIQTANYHGMLKDGEFSAG